MDDQNALKEILPLQPQLSKLQGILNQAKEKHYQFQEKSLDILENLESLAIVQPFNLEKMNKQYMKSIQDDIQFSLEEVQWYEQMINDIWKEISSQQQEKEKKYQELKVFMEQNHKLAFEQLDQQYKISQEDLAQKDGTGKLYGRPKRLAQERLRLEMTKCEQAGICITDLLEKLQKCNDSQELRILMITLRNCCSRYAFHIEALNEKAPEMIRLSRIDNRLGVNILADEQEKDKQQQEQELDILGSLAYQSEKSKKFSGFVQVQTNLQKDIEKAVKEECQKIYQGPSAKWLTGVDKLPDWIRPYLDTIRKNMNEFRISCCSFQQFQTDIIYNIRNFREQCEKLSELAPNINLKIFESINQKNTFLVIQQTKDIQNEFQQFIIQENQQKVLHSRLLRPNLYNPACKQELEDLIKKENSRQQEFQSFCEKTKDQFMEKEFNISNQFFTCLLNNFEFLLTFYDNWILFEDFNLLPGDEQIVKKNQNLQTLYKLKQEGKQIDYNSERSITKIWPGIPLNSFKVENREFQFIQLVTVQDDSKTKGAKANPKQAQESVQSQQNNNESKNIKSFKTQRQKTAYQFQIKVFEQYKNRFDLSLQQQNKIFEDSITEEKKFQYKWEKSLEDLFK